MFSKGMCTEALTYRNQAYLVGQNVESTTEINSVEAYAVDTYVSGASDLESLTEFNSPFWFYYGSDVYDRTRTVLVAELPSRAVLVPSEASRVVPVPLPPERKVYAV